MKLIISIFIISSILSYYDIENHKKIVSYINNLRTTWKANLNKIDISSILSKNYKQKELTILSERKYFYASRSYLPDNYDLRKEYPKCDSIKEIYDQSNCDSSWAISSAQAISDRICIYTGGNLQTRISPTHIISCCPNCGLGCEGGNAATAFIFWKEGGIPTGGKFGDKKTCKPYFLKPDMDNELLNRNEYPIIPECENKCQKGYNKSIEEDKSYGLEIYYVKGEENIMKEIFENGPVVSTFNVYEDFIDYKSGIYQHITGEIIGMQNIKIIGWGINDDGIKYWLCANGWNVIWGEKGFFRILKGENECGIEEYAIAGMPKI